MSPVTTPSAASSSSAPPPDPPAGPSADGRLLDRPAALPRRHPVLSFLGLVLLVCAVLAGVGRSGATVPQAEVQTLGDVGMNTTSCALAYSLVNHGLRPLEVEAVTAWGRVRVADPDTELTSAEAVMDLDPRSLPAFAPFTLAGGSHRDLVVEAPCPEPGVVLPELEVHIRSTDAGLRRTLTL